MIEDVVNFLIEVIGELISVIFVIFPNSPFLDMENTVPDNVVLAYITWLIPFPAMISHLVIYLGVLATYYIVRIAGRWLKMLRS